MKVLITSGGGAKGAFSVGVLSFLKNERGIDKFDMISGTSTGALIASMVAAGKIDKLEEVYKNTTNADVLAPQNLIDSITNGDPFIFDTEPLLKQLRTHITDSTFDDILNSGTILYLNAVSLQTGRRTVFSTTDIFPSNHYARKKVNTPGEFREALLASSNQPVFHNPMLIDGEQFVDGGTREVIPTRIVCNNLSLEEDHEIYMLSNNPNEIISFPGKEYSSILDVLFRTISIFVQETRENDLELMAKFKTLSKDNGNNVKIFYLCPQRELDEDFPTGLRFDRGLMTEWMFEGEDLAREIIETTPAGNFPEFHLSNRSFV
jgi:predicted patatin/cPLA2 family phospholipase